MMLSEKTSQALDEIVGAFFDLNRTFDRCVSWMQNKWCMPQAADIIHHKLAHVWPLMADKVSGFKDQYNMTTRYPLTHEDNRTYNNLMEMMNVILKETTEVYDMIKMVYGIAQEERDLNAQSMLYSLTQDMNVLISQIITLYDKSEQMSTEYDQYDRHITSWGIVGLEAKGENY